jgi:chromosome segregation ATPase
MNSCHCMTKNTATAEAECNPCATNTNRVVILPWKKVVLHPYMIAAVWEQRYRALLQQAELEASQAKQEMEILQREIDTLRKRQLTEKDDLQRDMVRQQAIEHELRVQLKSKESEYTLVRHRLIDVVRENKALNDSLKEQQNAMDAQAKQHQAEKQSLEEQLRAAETAKATAEAKLEEAMEKIEAIKKQLDEQAAAKSVRFSEQSNEVIVFRATDYTSRLAQSEKEHEELASQLKSMKLEMEELEEAHSSLESMHRETKLEHQQELSVVKQAAQEARSQVRDLLSSLVEMQQNAERIEKERLELEEILEEAHGAREQASAKLLKKEKDYERVEREVAKINKAILSMQQDGSKSSKSIEDSKSENLLYELEKARFRLEKQATTIQSERKTLQETVANATKQYGKINDQLVVMELEKKELMQQLEDLKRTVSALREENSRVHEEKLSMEKALLDQQSLVARSQARVQELEIERATLQEELQSINMASQINRSSAPDVETLRSIGAESTDNRVSELEDQLAKTERALKGERDRLRESVEKSNVLESKLAELQKELDSVKNEKTALEASHAEEMKLQIQATQEAEAMAEEARKQVEEMKKHRSDTQEQLRELMEVRTSLQKQLQEATDKLWFIQQEKEHLNSRLTALDIALKEAREDAKCSVSTNVFVLQRNSLKMQLQQKESEIDNLKRQVKTAELEADKKDEQIKELKAVEAALEEQIHSLCQELETAFSELEQAKSKIESLQAENNSLQSSLCEAESSIRKLEESNNHMQEEKQKLEAEYEQKISQVQNDHTLTMLQVSNLERERIALSRTIESFDDIKADLNAKLNETTGLWEEAKAQFQLKKRDLKDTRKELESQRRENKSLQEQLTSIKSEKLIIVDQLEETSRQAEDLKLDLVLLGQRNNALEEEKSEIDAKVAAVEKELAQLKSEMAHMMAEHKQDLEKEASLLSIANTNIERAEDEKSSLQGTVDGLLKEKNELQIKLVETKGMWKNATDQFRRKQKRIQDLEQQLKAVEQHRVSLQAECDRLTLLSKENEDVATRLELASTALSQTSQENEAVAKQADVFKQERDLALLAEVGLRKVAEDLQQKLDAQTKKVKKLAKILKRTIEKQSEKEANVATVVVPSDNDEGAEDLGERRVSRMAIVLKMRYQNKNSGSMEQMDVSAEYTGPLVDGKPHGPGMVRFESGDLYLGEFQDGEMNGAGSYIRRRPPREGDNVCLSGMFANNEFIMPISPSTSSSSMSN